MRKTLLQTILAAFCAILCATSMGGGGMRRRMMACVANNLLPPGYEALDYLIASGYQIINTGLAETGDVTVEMDVKTDGVYNCDFAGTHNNYMEYDASQFILGFASMNRYFLYSSYESDVDNVWTSDFHHLIALVNYSRISLKVDDYDAVVKTRSRSSYNRPICICACGNDFCDRTYHTKSYYKAVNVSAAGGTVNLIPVLNKTTRVAGMCDILTGTIYNNTQSGHTFGYCKKDGTVVAPT